MSHCGSALQKHILSTLWPVGSFFIYYYPLHKETSPMRARSCTTNLWASRYIFRGRFDAVSTNNNNNNNRISSRACELLNCGFLAQIDCARHAFPPVEVGLRPDEKMVVYILTFVPPLRPWVYLATWSLLS